MGGLKTKVHVQQLASYVPGLSTSYVSRVAVNTYVSNDDAEVRAPAQEVVHPILRHPGARQTEPAQAWAVLVQRSQAGVAHRSACEVEPLEQRATEQQALEAEVGHGAEAAAVRRHHRLRQQRAKVAPPRLR